MVAVAKREASRGAWLRELLGHDPAGWRQPTATISRWRVLLSAGFVWLSTVAWPCWRAEEARQTWVLGVACVGTLLMPLAGAFVPGPALGRALGLWGFVGCSLGTWLLLGSSLEVSQVEPLRGLIGSVGWALFAFTWGSVRRVDAIPEDNPKASVDVSLTPRSRLAPVALTGLTLTLAGSWTLIGIAWLEPRPVHALFAHAVALLSSLALVQVGSHFVGVEQARAAPGAVTQRLQATFVPLALALAWVIAGAVYWLT